MTNYTITYRADDGSIATTTLEAADRAACVAACRARGITPVSIKEGQASKAKGHTSKPRNSETPKPRNFETPKLRNPETSKPRSLQVSVLALLALVAIGAAVWFFFLRAPSESVSESDVKPSAKVVKEPKPARQPKVPAASAATNATVKAVVPEVSAPAATNEVVLSVVTNKSGYIVERVQLPDGTTAKRVHTPPPIFDNVSDQMIAMVVSVPPGQSIPPLPHDSNLDESFRKSLGTEIKILETDTPEVRELKAAVLATRVELAELIKKGYTVQQALDEHCRLANENADVHASALVEMKALLKAGDLEGAQKYAERMNKEFREMGIEEVKVPRENVTDEAVKAVRAREIIEKIREKKESKNETEY